MGLGNKPIATAPAKTPPEVPGPASTSWSIPWEGRTARLTVNRPLFGRYASVLVDGTPVASAAKSTLEEPWVECPLPGRGSRVLVVQVQMQKYLAKTLVFVDGLCLDDGTTLDDWRSRQPAAIDGFEQSFAGPFWGPLGALTLGLVGALPFIAQYTRTSNLFWLAWAAGAFLFGSGWMLAGMLLTRWLKTKRSWPDPLRRLMVPFVMIGLPVLAIMAIASHR